MCSNIIEMPVIDAIIFGFTLGLLIAFSYFYFMIKYLKKNKYITLEPTKKLLDKFKYE